MLKKSKFNNKLITALNVADENDEIEFLVYGRNLNLIESCLKKQNCKVKTLGIINAVASKTTKRNFISLKFCGGVSKIEACAKVNCLVNTAVETTNINMLHKMGLTGKGVNVAVIDTGISPHIDLCLPRRKLIYFKNFLDDNESPFDDNGHGTFVAGTIASSGLTSFGKYKGVAPNCNLIVLKALNGQGEASALKILEAIQWISDNAKKYNIKILCLSIGSEPEENNDPLAKAVETLYYKGICVVVAAGNSGPIRESIKSPGISNYAITVGAIDDRTEKNKIKIADFSSRGPCKNYVKPDIVAPGVEINGLSSKLKSPYIKLSGTSMSAPIVAGFCALLIEKNPNLTPLQLKYIVKNCGRKFCFDVYAEGSGVLDASKLFVK